MNTFLGTVTERTYDTPDGSATKFFEAMPPEGFAPMHFATVDEAVKALCQLHEAKVAS